MDISAENIANNNFGGFDIIDTKDCLIYENEAENNDILGIGLFEGLDTDFFNNTAKDNYRLAGWGWDREGNGFLISSCESVDVYNNYAFKNYVGMLISECTDCDVKENTMNKIIHRQIIDLNNQIINCQYARTAHSDSDEKCHVQGYFDIPIYPEIISIGEKYAEQPIKVMFLGMEPKQDVGDLESCELDAFTKLSVLFEWQNYTDESHATKGEKAQEESFCEFCGMKLETGVKACSNCGKKSK